MDAVKFIEERNRMCKSFGNRCTGCPASNDGCAVGQESTLDAKEQAAIVEKWSAEHPRKTRQSVFLEHWPNRVAKSINNSIAEDDLWRGRFIMRQKKFQFYQYDDKSGLYVDFWYEFEDLKTGQKKIYLFNNLEMDFNGPFISHVWWAMNSFIVDYCDVWREDGKEAIYADKTFYRRK